MLRLALRWEGSSVEGEGPASGLLVGPEVVQCCSFRRDRRSVVEWRSNGSSMEV